MPHDHGHGHHHHHHHVGAEDGDRRVGAAIAVNFLLTVVQIVGGILSGSLALIADAIHNLSDAMSLVIAFAARRIARRPADDDMTFGYARAETVAALINYTTLILLAVYLAYEAVWRFIDPREVQGWLIVWIAAVALLVDVITALLTWRMAKDSLNIRAAFLHNLADALGSVGVIVGGALIILFDWNIVDPIITLMIAAYILWHAREGIGAVIRVLMLGRPHGISAEAALAAIHGVDGVQNAYHLHLWQMDEASPAVTAHVTLAPGRWAEADAIKQAVREALRGLGVVHCTLELECANHAVTGAPAIGHKA